MVLFLICIVIMIIGGLLMIFAPEKCVSANKRDDAEAIKETVSLGKKVLAFTVFAALLCLKYKMR